VCQSEAVAYAEFKKEHPKLVYLGINVASTTDEARDFVKKYDWDWPSIHDPQRVRARSLGAEYQPHVILVDADGGIVGRHVGGGSKAEWERLAAKLS
jgi:hypothetical protein